METHAAYFHFIPSQARCDKTNTTPDEDFKCMSVFLYSGEGLVIYRK